MLYQFKTAKAILLESNKNQYPNNTILKYGYAFGEEYSQLCYEDCAIRTPHKYMYIYITAAEDQDKIRKGDWCMLGGSSIRKCDGFTYDQDGKTINGYSFGDGTKDTRSICQKIIASNDPDLELRGLSEEFIEKYISAFNDGNVITEVQVEYQTDFKPETKLIMIGNGHRVDDIEYGHQIRYNKEDNSIIIKKHQLTWTKEQVEQLCAQAFDAGYDFKSAQKSTIVNKEEWLKDNI